MIETEKKSNFSKLKNKDGLAKYYESIKRFNVLTHEQSVELFQKYNNGEKSARNKIIESNLRLVISIACAYNKKYDIPIEDLIQEGNIGLIKSIDKFDWKKGFKFSTYASWWIKQSIGQFLLKKRKTIRVPAHIVGLQKKANKAIEEYKKEFNGVEPTEEELSDLVGSTKKSLKAMKTNKNIVSLSSVINSSSEMTHEDVLQDNSYFSDPFNVVALKELVAIVKDAAEKHITPKENSILRLRFGIEEEPVDYTNYTMSHDEYMKVVKKANDKDQ